MHLAIKVWAVTEIILEVNLIMKSIIFLSFQGCLPNNVFELCMLNQPTTGAVYKLDTGFKGGIYNS